MSGRKARGDRLRQERLEEERAQANRSARRRRLIWGGSALGLLVVALLGAGIVLGGSDDSAPPPKLTEAERASAPKRLAANLDQGNEIIDGSIQDKLAELRGVPVVVNQWASWCTSCRAEFGYFQQLSEQLRDRVAFVGLDSQDERGSAEDFLAEYPVNYPSIFDQSAEQAASIGAGLSWPTTVYYDATGRRTYVRQGGYATAASLREDIERYALAKRG